MDLAGLWASLAASIPAVIGGILLILVAWIVAVLVKKAVSKGLRAVGLPSRFVKWNVAETEDQAETTIDTIAQILYYIVWVLFLPGIFDTFGLTSIATPIRDMTSNALAFLPSIVGAIIIMIVAVVVARLVKQLVYSLVKTVNIDKYVAKFTGNKTADGQTADTIANVLSYVAYIVVFIPIAVVALETLGISSIATPIIGVLNSIAAAIPNILVAVILLGVGFAIAKVIGDLVQNLLEGTGLNNLFNRETGAATKNINVSEIIGQVVAVVIGLFFTVEALNVLNLAILNTVGAAIIAYLPNVLIALIILGLGIFGGRFVGDLVNKATQSKWVGEIIKGVFVVFSVFMALDQLNFANNIVNMAFLFIIGGLSVAFALSFGLGGRDFAKKQLEKLDKKIEEESGQNNNNIDQF
ncbi:mechanosensitive ion channel [Aerococcus sp. NPDC058936]|uniref:mechanosensitive ion channel n=1 Tax=Aerococcus sp. NPDC058936 TaxID=3346674 RepID=UPI00367107A7